MPIVVRDVEGLKKMVIKAGFSQRALGRVMGISEPYANQVVNGERNPGPAVAKKLCEVLGVDFDDIFFIVDAYKSEQARPTGTDP